MKVNIIRTSQKAVTPKYSKPGDAGLDITATTVRYDASGDYIEYGTDLKFEIPEGYVGMLFPRSSVSNYPMVLCNSVGILDSGFRGKVSFRYRINLPYYVAADTAKGFPLLLNEGLFACYRTESDEISGEYEKIGIYRTGDRVGQIIIMPYPQIEFVESELLSQTERGEGGYGSTGN